MAPVSHRWLPPHLHHTTILIIIWVVIFLFLWVLPASPMSHDLSPSAAKPDGAAGDQCRASCIFPGRRPGSEAEQPGAERPGGPEELALTVHAAPLPREAGQEQQGSKSVCVCLYMLIKMSRHQRVECECFRSSWTADI